MSEERLSRAHSAMKPDKRKVWRRHGKDQKPPVRVADAAPAFNAKDKLAKETGR